MRVALRHGRGAVPHPFHHAVQVDAALDHPRAASVPRRVEDGVFELREVRPDLTPQLNHPPLRDVGPRAVQSGVVLAFDSLKGLGRQRDRAILPVLRVDEGDGAGLQVGGSAVQHDVSADERGLPVDPEISDVSATNAEDAGDIEGLNNWVAADAVPAVTVRYESDRSGNREIEIPQSAFSWAAKRNERRRKQAAKQNEEAA